MRILPFACLTMIVGYSPLTAAEPVCLIFDTDIGNDVDDVLALGVIHSLQSRGHCELLAVTITKDNPKAAAFTDAVNTFPEAAIFPTGRFYVRVPLRYMPGVWPVLLLKSLHIQWTSSNPARGAIALRGKSVERSRCLMRSNRTRRISALGERPIVPTKRRLSVLDDIAVCRTTSLTRMPSQACSRM